MYIKKIEKVTLKACYFFSVITLISIFFRKYQDVRLSRDRARGARGSRARAEALHGGALQEDRGEPRASQEGGARAGADAPARGGRDEGEARRGRAPAELAAEEGGAREADQEQRLEAGEHREGGQAREGQHQEGGDPLQLRLRPRRPLGRPDGGVWRCRRRWRRRWRRRCQHAHLGQGGVGWTPHDRGEAVAHARHLQPPRAADDWAHVHSHPARELLPHAGLQEHAPHRLRARPAHVLQLRPSLQVQGPPTR